MNAAALFGLRQLGEPRGGHPEGRVAPGRPVFLRAGLLVPVVIAALLAFAVTRPTTTVRGLATGDCIVDRGSRVEEVPCGRPNDGRVVAVADDENACPASADEVYVPDGSRGGPVLCVDSTS
jgi:hypothetical protein